MKKILTSLKTWALSQIFSKEELYVREERARQKAEDEAEFLAGGQPWRHLVKGSPSKDWGFEWVPVKKQFYWGKKYGWKSVGWKPPEKREQPKPDMQDRTEKTRPRMSSGSTINPEDSRPVQKASRAESKAGSQSKGEYSRGDRQSPRSFQGFGDSQQDEKGSRALHDIEHKKKNPSNVQNETKLLDRENQDREFFGEDLARGARKSFQRDGTEELRSQTHRLRAHRESVAMDSAAGYKYR